MAYAYILVCYVIPRASPSELHKHPRMYMLRPDSQPLTRFEAGQRIQFQSRSDLNWLAVLTESVYKLELHQCSHGDRYDAALRDADARLLRELESDYTTRRREAMLSLECTFNLKLELDCIEDSCATEESVATTFHTVLAVCSTEINSGSPPVSMNVLVIVIHLTVQTAQACI